MEEEVAEMLHLEHAREFPGLLTGDHLSDPMPASACAICQRWARYAQAAGLTLPNQPNTRRNDADHR